jgi:lipopolysaccharide export system permease protein
MNLRISIVQKYLAREILVAVGFVLIAFIGLFAFFDLIAELSDIGKNGYTFTNAVVLVLLGLPGRCYELLPISALIGTIYALAQLASRSEFTIMRVAGLSTNYAARMVLVPGLVLVALTYLVGEVITPATEKQTQVYRANIARGTMSEAFKTGLWVKDSTQNDAGEERVRFVNIGTVNPDRSLERVRIYEFDPTLHLTSIRFADSAKYDGTNSWKLKNVVETRFTKSKDNAPEAVTVTNVASEHWHSEINPEILGVLLVQPDRMAAAELDNYIHHLEDNRQAAERYQIAFWKKIIYPFAVLVMMALGLPFAYLQVRAGGVSLKIFAGIMIGIGFYLLNSLFSHLGMLNTWPPFLSAALPSVVVLLAAGAALRRVERH